MGVTDHAHRGYLVRHNSMSGITWVEKDGQLICHADHDTDARNKIDELLHKEEAPKEALTIEGADNITKFHQLQLKYALMLEIRGLRHSRGSVYSHIKKSYGLRGSRTSVLQQFCEKFGLEDPKL